MKWSNLIDLIIIITTSTLMLVMLKNINMYEYFSTLCTLHICRNGDVIKKKMICQIFVKHRNKSEIIRSQKGNDKLMTIRNCLMQ